MKKVYSARRRLIHYFSLLLALTLLVLLAFGGYSMWTYDQQLRYCADAALELYREALLGETQRLVALNQQVSADWMDFRLLTAASLDQGQRSVLRYRLKSAIEIAVPDTGLILLCDADGDWLQYTYGRRVLNAGGLMGVEHQNAAHALRDACLRVPEEQQTMWLVAECGSFTFLYNVYSYKQLRICSAIELHTFARESAASSTENIQLLFEQDGAFLTGRELAAEKQLRAGQLPGSRGLFFDYVLDYEAIPALRIGLCCLIPVQGIWQYSRISLLVLAVMAAICVAGYVHTYRLMDHIVIYPLKQVSALSHQLSQVEGEDSPRILERDQVEELNTLRDSLNHLAAQKVELQKRSDDFEMEKEHAQLQYYQLQTRSHFFLNCLKSLYGMLETRDFSRMQTMIIAFSNHLRFIFHDNLTLVPVRAEMDEVADYHRIISMDSRQPLILTKEVAPDAERCLVPPLIVQTFLENAYKYNGRGREVLHFTVRIDRLEYEGKPRLRIRVCDDGVGYPADMLAWLNGQSAPGAFDQYHIGINNLRRRMAILYSGDFELAFFNGASGGASILISIPAREEGEDAP